MDAVDIRHNGNVYTTHMCGFDRVLWYRKCLQLAQPLGVRQKQWVLTGGNNGIWKESVLLWYTHPLVFMTLICPLTRTLLNRWNASSQIQGLGCVCGRCCFCFCSFCFVLFFWCWGMDPGLNVNHVNAITELYSQPRFILKEMWFSPQASSLNQPPSCF